MGGDCVLLLLLAGCVLADDQLPPSASTPLGGLTGRWESSRGGRRFAAFLGVPYGKPPVGKLRLQAPLPADAWNGTRQATEEGPFCIQANTFMKAMFKEKVVGQEDCLYLSVFTHNVSGSMPVLVHIHGGAFTMGNARWYKPHYLMDEDLVVVNINYRVGIMGFLTFETDDLRGNQGMKDQVLALRWVRENIASFGGDPKSVTINGESAGGASVYHHIVSPQSRGLYQRAISESGSSYSPWALSVPGSARRLATRLMTLVGCPTEPKLAVPCIMEKDAFQLTEAFHNFTLWQVDPINIFGPSLEPAGPEAFLTGPVSSWNHNPVPLLVGLNSAEGLVRTLMFLAPSGNDISWLSSVLDSKAPMSLMYQDSAPNPEDITRSLREYYLPRENLTMEDWVNLTNLYGDSWFTTSVIEGADRHTGDVYFIYFDVRENDIAPTPFPIDKKLIFGSTHAQELVYLWNMSGFLSNATEVQDEWLELSKKLIKSVVHFARTGTPGMDDWKKWTAEDHTYMLMDDTGFRPMKGIAEDRVRFWKTLDYRSKYDKTADQNVLL